MTNPESDWVVAGVGVSRSLVLSEVGAVAEDARPLGRAGAEGGAGAEEDRACSVLDRHREKWSTPLTVHS